MRLLGRAPALLHVARRAGADDVFPRRSSAQTAGDDMVEGQMVAAAAILALEPVAQEQVEPGESGKFAVLHILPQRDHDGDLHVETGRMARAGLNANSIKQE